MSKEKNGKSKNDKTPAKLSLKEKRALKTEKKKSKSISGMDS